MNDSLAQRMQNEHFDLVSIDLFSGPGGLCTGFKWAGILPLIAVEWTATTVETYSKSHNAEVMHLAEYVTEEGNNEDYLAQFMCESTRSLVIHGDINLVDDHMIKDLLLHRYGIDSEIETVDVVSGGAPCESFSIAGTRTLGDERDDLFDNIVRISRTVNTKMILFENVKGMFSKKSSDGVKGAIFRHICDTFDDQTAEPAYRLVSRDQGTILLKACDYGVPQLRERLFLVSVRADLVDGGTVFTYPTATHGPGTETPYVTVGDALSDLPPVESNQEIIQYDSPSHYNNDRQQRFVEIMRGIKIVDGINSIAPAHTHAFYDVHALSSHKGPGHIKRKQALLSAIPPNSSMRDEYKRLEEEGRLDEQIPGFEEFTYRQVFPNTIYGSRNRRLRVTDPSYTVTSHCLDELLHPTQNRAITPREAARLQSFPDWYQFAGPYVQFHGAHEQDRYEQIGDAIPPLLAYALAKQIVECLTNHI